VVCHAVLMFRFRWIYVFPILRYALGLVEGGFSEVRQDVFVSSLFG
jgi:hypothetical protein